MHKQLRSRVGMREVREKGEAMREQAPATKADWRRKLGLVGAGAQGAAHQIHQSGGLRDG